MMCMNMPQHPFLVECRTEAFATRYLDRLHALLGEMDTAAIARFVHALVEARERGARIFFIGNGGSAATAAHFANDIGVGSQSWSKPFKAVSLVDNVAVLTALANDYGYDHVFTLQLKTQMSPGDVVVAISASGNSPNVVRAIEYANANGAVTTALTGFDGGRLKELAEISVHVPTKNGEYGPVEDVHMILDHLVGSYLSALCRSESSVGV
jgi:D-sedoheptulose 7-phosphate isomerase